MRNILTSVFVFLFSSTAFGAVTFQGAVPSFSLGGVTRSNVKVLTANASPASSYDGLRENGSSYQVPSGKTLIIRAVRVYTSNATSVGAVLGYGDSSVNNSVSAPTNFVPRGAGGFSNSVALTAASAGSFIEYPVYITIPSLKYPTMQCISGPAYIVVLAEEI